MSRRPADKAAQNQQVIKNLLKLEANKNCADCKRNKHPRWASWNLGIFICIRCSGIHRGMGTHISRVKSVDLDAWTDDQLQSIMKWGNARANRYWESKLAQGHVPSDAKIENFIRTKYESKRWVIDGPMPDPSSLGGDGDEDVPLTTVQEKARLDRSASQRAASTSGNPASQNRRAQPSSAVTSFNLIDGDDPIAIPPRASTTEPPSTAGPAPPRTTAAQPSHLLGGLDFLGSPPERSSSASSGVSSMSRPDLKQSILSLYASKPATHPATSHSSTIHSRQPSAANKSMSNNADSYGGLNDAFGSLTFGSDTPVSKPSQTTSQIIAPKPAFAPGPTAQPAKPDAYAALSGVLSNPQSSLTSPQATSPQTASPPAMLGGNFFDSHPRATPKQASPTSKTTPAPPLATHVSNEDWGDFSMASGTNSLPSRPAAKSQNNGLLDFTSGAAANFSTPPPPAATTATAVVADSSVFNLSSKAAQSSPKTSSVVPSNFPSDPWATNEWANPEKTPSSPSVQSNVAPKQPANDFGWSAPSEWVSSTATSSTAKTTALDMGGWNDSTPSGMSTELGKLDSTVTSAPRVQPEEDFGGWGASEPMPNKSEPQRQSSQSQTGGVVSSNSDDLFANVWG